jgi:hypothetical protein
VRRACGGGESGEHVVVVGALLMASPEGGRSAAFSLSSRFPSPAEGGTVVDLATGATFHYPEGRLPQPLVGTAAVCNAAIDPSDPGCQASCRARC